MQEPNKSQKLLLVCTCSQSVERLLAIDVCVVCRGVVKACAPEKFINSSAALSYFIADSENILFYYQSLSNVNVLQQGPLRTEATQTKFEVNFYGYHRVGWRTVFQKIRVSQNFGLFLNVSQSRFQSDSLRLGVSIFRHNSLGVSNFRQRSLGASNSRPSQSI